LPKTRRIARKIFLVTKSDARDPRRHQQAAGRSLERMQTDYIDLYFLHGMRSIDELNDDVRRWAEKAKAEKRSASSASAPISNMEELLRAVEAGLDRRHHADLQLPQHDSRK
jgi:uncharacterized protein